MLRLPRVHERSTRELCSVRYSAAQIDDWVAVVSPESHLALITHPGLFFIVDEDENRIRGIRVCEPFTGTVNAVYVPPDVSGQGVGAALLERLETEIAAAGTTRAHLNATLNATSFYERHGYGNGHPAVNTLSSGVKLPCIAYDKDVGL